MDKSLDTLVHALNELRCGLHDLGVEEGCVIDHALKEAIRLLSPAAADASIPGAPRFLLEALARAETEAALIGNEWRCDYDHGTAEAIRIVCRALIEPLAREVAGDVAE